MIKDDFILCPICGKEKFKIEDHFIFCNHCGWEGNMNVDDHFVELNGYSAKDYRKIYQEYLKEHPNYIWKNDTEALDKYVDSFNDNGSICPVCGEDSLEPDYRHCYKCGWKYNFVQAQFPDFEDSSNRLSLNQYKEQYNHLIKDNSKYEWKNTENVNFPFNEKQIKWIRDNKIEEFDKLTAEDKLHNIVDSILLIQKNVETKKDYEEYKIINSIVNIILNNI